MSDPECDLYIDVQVYGGAQIPEAIEQMVTLAKRLQVGVWAELNGVRVLARPDDHPKAIYEAWDAAVTHKGSHASAVVRRA